MLLTKIIDGLIGWAMVLLWLAVVILCFVKMQKNWRLKRRGESIIWGLLLMCLLSFIEWIVFFVFVGNCVLISLGCSGLNS